MIKVEGEPQEYEFLDETEENGIFKDNEWELKDSSFNSPETKAKLVDPIKEFVSRVSAMEGREIVVNVAGNRESVCPGIRTTVRELLIKCIEDDKA